jgi:Flp pilus assembly protein TadB
MSNFLFSLMFGFGVFLTIISLRINITKKKSTIDRIARITDVEPHVYTGGSFFTSVRKNGLSVALAQADLDVSRAGFIRTGLMLAAGVVAGGYVLTGSLIVAMFMGLGSIYMYSTWLHMRRDQRYLEYEESLADMADRLAAGALLTGTFQGALVHATELAPAILKSDFEKIANAVIQGATISEAFDPIREKRHSYSLDLLVDSLMVWSVQGTTVPLAEVLEPLSVTIRSMANERKRMESELKGARNQLLFVAVAPLMFVAILRSAGPGFGEIYASPPGIVIQLVSYSIAAIGYRLGEKQMEGVRRVLDVTG